MYLKHFGLADSPFSLTPDTGFLVDLAGHQQAMNVLLVALAGGEGFIKITGEVGTGKTLLCRRLLETLDHRFATAYLPNPMLNPGQLHLALLEEFGLPVPQGASLQTMLKTLAEHLVGLRKAGRQAVLCIDEAQAMPTESLEAVRLLSNLETGKRKLLQIVLFGQPELNARLRRHELRQLRQRITFSYDLPTLGLGEVETYVERRLQIAGCREERIFTRGAVALVHRGSGGIPRLVNILCHKGLLAGYGRGDRQIGRSVMRAAVADTEDAADNTHPGLRFWRLLAPSVLVLAGLCGLLLWQGMQP